MATNGQYSDDTPAQSPSARAQLHEAQRCLARVLELLSTASETHSASVKLLAQATLLLGEVEHAVRTQVEPLSERVSQLEQWKRDTEPAPPPSAE